MPPFNADLASLSCDGSVTTLSSFNSTTLHDDNIKNNANISTIKKIKKLNAEIKKLKAIADFTKAEAEETISEELEEISKKIDEQRMALTAAKIAKNQIKVKIDSKNDFIRFNEKCILEKESQLKKSEEERARMEEEMNYLIHERARLARKVNELEGMVSSVGKAMQDLLSDQESIIASTKMMEKQMEEQSSLKIEILKQFLESEIQLKNESKAIRVVDNVRYSGGVGGGGSKMNLLDALVQQKDRLRVTLSL